MAVHRINTKVEIISPMTRSDVMAKRKGKSHVKRQTQASQTIPDDIRQGSPYKQTQAVKQEKETMSQKQEQAKELENFSVVHADTEIVEEEIPPMEKVYSADQDKSTEDSAESNASKDDESAQPTKGPDEPTEESVETINLLLTKLDADGKPILPARISIPKVVGNHPLSTQLNKDKQIDASTHAFGVSICLESVDPEGISNTIKDFNSFYNVNLITGKYKLELVS